MLEKIRSVPVVTSAELENDAHEAFRRYRASYPFVALDTGGYVILRHEDVRKLIADPRLRATETAMPVQGGITEGALFDIFQHGMLTANASVHARRRSAMSRALANQLSDAFRRHVRLAAKGLLEDCYHDGRLELAAGYAAKLPVIALAGMFGIPDRDVPQFMHDIYEMNEFFRPHATAESVSKAEAAAARLQRYLGVLLTRTTAGQAEGFLSHYLKLAEEDDLSSAEVLIQIIQLIIGGTESVRTAIVAQAAGLLSSPDQWRAVCDDPALVPDAVAEALRFEPGIAGVVRVSVEDIDVDGWTLPAGQLVILSSISALRDERVFEHADSFDIFRPNLALSRLTFGGGAHRCVADALGRAELEESLAALTERLPNLSLDSAPKFYGHLFVRKSTECWITWQP